MMIYTESKASNKNEKIKHQSYYTVQGLHLKSTICVHMVMKLFSLVDIGWTKVGVDLPKWTPEVVSAIYFLVVA